MVIIEDSFAQNLIPNSSFESFDTSFVIENWIQFRSADFFNTNWNTLGSQWDKSTQPHSGKSFCGISLKGGQENLSEYIAISLKEPLFENQEYVFSCYLHNRANRRLINQFGVLIKDTLDKWNLDFLVEEPQLKLNKRYLGESQIGWFEFNMTYVAKGGEQAIYIGNFEEPENSKLKKSKAQKSSYYYIDDISFEATEQVHFLLTHDSIPKYNSVFIIEGIEFETDSSNIKFTQRDVLDKFILHAKQNSNTYVVIGHTDSTGLEENNIDLSIKRAEKVYNYLIANGISKYRLSFEGMGSSIPLSKSDLSLNRRIEIKTL